MKHTRKSRFFTASKQAEGVKFPLRDPSGKETDEFLVVIGRFAPDFLKAEQELSARVAGTLQAGEELPDNDDSIVTLRATLVTGWSFDEPCTLETVKEFLIEAPQVAAALDKFASNMANFTGPSSDDSSSTPKPTRDSGKKSGTRQSGST